MSMLNKILLIYFLFYKILCPAVDLRDIDLIETVSTDRSAYEYMQCFNQKANSKLDIAKEEDIKKACNDSLKDLSNIESNVTETTIKEEKNNLLIYELCSNVLREKNFLLPNSNWLAIKIFFALLAPISVGSSNLAIAFNSKVTVALIVLTQFAVPLYINNIFKLLDKIKLLYKSYNFKKNFFDLTKQLHISIYLCLNLLVSLCLGYIASLLNFQLSGIGYVWIFSNFTRSKIALSFAYYFGYISKLLFLLPLNTMFFFNLIEEFLAKTGIGSFCKILQPAKISQQETIYKKHIKKINKRIKNDNYDYSMNILKNYLFENRLNTTLDIANLKLYCFNNKINNKKLEYIIINMFKLVFIAATTLVCAEAFKTIFTAKLLLKNYITTFANSTTNGTYFLTLNDKSLYYCNTVDHCIKNLNFNQININKQEINYVLSENLLASIVYILSGIAMSSNVATMLIDFTHYSKKMVKNSNFRKTILSSLLRKQNIIPFLFATSLIAPSYYYMENVYNVFPIAEQSNNLLARAGKKSFLSTDSSIAFSIFYLELTFVRGVTFLVDISRILISQMDKLRYKNLL